MNPLRGNFVEGSNIEMSSSLISLLVKRLDMVLEGRGEWRDEDKDL